jgi:hypothetical protein
MRARRCSSRHAVLQAIGTPGVKAQHPIADRVQADAADAGRIAARAGVLNLGERQQPPGKRCIIGLFGRHAKLRANESLRERRPGRA